jgi:four helix bundle protein
MKSFDLDERMIVYSVKVIKLAESLPKTSSGLYFSDQMIRSVSSAVLNYSEAQSAESRKDFIHKVKISLKELRETYTGLRMTKQLFGKNEIELSRMIDESNQLISILVTSVNTARKNMQTGKS